eukprot:ctg_2227.g437
MPRGERVRHRASGGRRPPAGTRTPGADGGAHLPKRPFSRAWHAQRRQPGGAIALRLERAAGGSGAGHHPADRVSSQERPLRRLRVGDRVCGAVASGRLFDPRVPHRRASARYVPQCQCLCRPHHAAPNDSRRRRRRQSAPVGAA